MENRRLFTLLAGDIVTIALVTVIGFARHNELGSAGWRMMTTFVPLLAAWLLVAPVMGVFDAQRSSDPKQLWRAVYSGLLAAPFFAWMRAVWLSTPIEPVFVTVMGAVTALGILIWRFLFWRFLARGS